MKQQSMYGIQAYSYDDAVAKITQGDSSETTTANVELMVPFLPPTTTTLSSLQTALTASIHLKVLHISVSDFCHGSHNTYRDVGLDLCRGLQSNTSIETVVCALSPVDRTIHHAIAWKDVLHSSSTLRTLHLVRLPGVPAPNRNPLSTTKNKANSPCCHDAYAETIIQGLKYNTTLQDFKLESYTVLSNATKEKCIDIVAMNRTLKEIYLEFQEWDYRLRFLVANNVKRWTDRIGTLSYCNSTSENRDEDNPDVVDILTETMNVPCIDSVAIHYHLLQTCPHILRRDA